MYLSQIGLSMALAWGVWSVYRSRQSLDAARWRQWLLAVVAGGTVIVLAAVAWRQTSYWRNAETLWTHSIACIGPNLIAHSNLAAVCLREERTEEAIAHLRAATAAGFVYPQVLAMCHLIFANLLSEHGKADEAFTHYEETVRLFPAGERGHARLAIALAAAGQHDRAIAEWRESIRLSPTLWSAHIGLADALLANGDIAGAAAECRAVLNEEPGAIEAIVILGMALAAEGKVEQAIPRWERVVELDPRNARAHFRLGLALHDRDQSQSAIAHLNMAIQLQPDSVPMLWQTAWILATSPDPSIRDGARAVGLATRAVQLSKGQEPRFGYARRGAGRNRGVFRSRRRGRASVDPGAAPKQ